MAYNRVNWEDSPSTNTPVNATNLNTMDAGIEQNANDIEDLQDDVDEVKSNLDYSNEEKIVGHWNGKPLYRKSFFNISFTSSFTHNIANVDTIFFDASHSFFSWAGDNTTTFSGFSNYTSNCCITAVGKTIMKFVTTGNFGTPNINATVLYTKTTD